MLQRLQERIESDANGFRAMALEVFIVANMAFLALDIYLAHRLHTVHHVSEWIPFVFSILATVTLLVAMTDGLHPLTLRSRSLGALAGIGSVAVGMLGLWFHLNHSFLSEMTLEHLVYTAPLVAPLSYAGLGFLLLLNRMVAPSSREWGLWVVFFALGGTFGNFVLTLCDHAQNGFFHWTEWLPVATSAFATGALAAVVVVRANTRSILTLTGALLVAQALCGVAGFFLHGAAVIESAAPTLFERVMWSAPLFAPLLLPNLCVLAALGLWQLWALDVRASRRDAPPVQA